MYTITYAPAAKEGLAKLKRSEPAAFKKAFRREAVQPNAAIAASGCETFRAACGCTRNIY